MEQISTLMSAWDEAHWEFTLAFEGLSDQDLWRRASPQLLSVGELASHVAYGEAQLLGAGVIESPLVDVRCRYYLDHVHHPVELPLGCDEVLAELKSVHEAVTAAIRQVESADIPTPGRPEWTWLQAHRYQVFHVSYHCGQAFSVRHLMGHKTNDN
jgi:hypothetical protein